MIVTIADDLTGAAEIAGIAAARGLSAEVQLAFDPQTRSDVVAVDTETRSLSEAEATKTLRDVVARVIAAAPRAIYKKTDSVLRGNVRAEIETILERSNQSRALLIPANPKKGRLICNGHYTIEGRPLHTTCFAQDPEHPRHSADVRDLLGRSGAMTIHSCQGSASLKEEGILIPDVRHVRDLCHWRDAWNDSALAAGAAEFFDALLDRWHPTATRVQPHHQMGARRLMISGSWASWELGIARSARQCGVPVFSMHETEFQETKSTAPDVSSWIEDAVDAFVSGNMVLMAIGDPDQSHSTRTSESVTPKQAVPPAAVHHQLLTPLIEAASCVARRLSIECLLMEGGETAAAFVRRMGWNRFVMRASAFDGVGVMRPTETAYAPELIIKPGSYPWPREVWTN